MISPSNAECYARAKEIFFAALELEGAERAELVQRRCGDDPALRGEVESLLMLRDEARDFLELPALKTIPTHEYFKDKIIGGYRLIRELGEGGMGVVFLAEKGDAEFSRQVALKIVKSDLHSEAIFKRFNLERQILNRLEHPNIAHLIDGGTTADGLPYFVMEYVAGVPLVGYAKSNQLSLDARLELFRQACAAVSFAHKHAVIHRDLKPSNILVTTDGIVKLLDFGVAKMLSADTSPLRKAATTVCAMTPEYASPEQVTGESVTTVSDVYSLGVVLYELLTGARPYKVDAENLKEIIRQVCEVEPARPSSVVARQLRGSAALPNRQGANDAGRISKLLKGDLDDIILKALRKEPGRRYSSVEAFWEDVRRHLDGLPVSARRDTFAYRAEKFIKRNRLAVASAALVVLALCGGIGATLWQARRAERERARAERRFNEVRTLANSFVFELNDAILKGQTQGRELVVKRALEYLNRLADEAHGDASLQRELAVAYLKIGDIQGKPYSPNLGDTEGAIASYGKALAILESLYHADPASREIQRDLSAAYADMGSIQWLRKSNRGEASDSLRKSLALCEGLIAADPTNAEYRWMLSDIYKSLGDLPGERDQRIASHHKALVIREELAAAEPFNAQDQGAIASLHQRIGQLLGARANRYGNTDDYRATLENFDAALAIYRALLAAEPDNSRHRRNVADMTAMRIPALIGLGKRAEAMKDYKAALATFEELSAADPNNAEARLDIAYTHQIMCQSFLKLNDPADALKSCRAGLSVAESLLEIDPTNAEVHNYVYASYNFIADALNKTGDVAGSLQTRQQLLAIAERWLATEPQDVPILVDIAHIRSDLGESHATIAARAKLSPTERKQHWLMSREWFTRSLDIWRDLQRRNAVREAQLQDMESDEQGIARCEAALGRQQ